MRGTEESNPNHGVAPHNAPPPPQKGCCCEVGGCISSFWRKYIRVDPAWLREVRGHLITAATLTATMAYQSILSPPGSFWQETTGYQNAPSPSGYLSIDEQHTAGQAIMDSKEYGFGRFSVFLCLNTIVLGASLSTIMLAMTGFPPENKFLTWLLVFTVYTTITCMGAAYLIAARLVSPDQFPDEAFFGLILGWMGVCAFVMVLHSCRLLVWICNKLVKLVKACCRCCRPTPRLNQNTTGRGNSSWQP